MIKLLIVKNKWKACDPITNQICDSEHHFMQVWGRLNFVQVTTFYYDQEIYLKGHDKAIKNLYELYEERFNVVLFNVYPFGIETNLQPYFIYRLKELKNIPFIFIWWDSYWNDGSVYNNIMGWYASISNLNIYIDSNHYMLNNGKCEYWPEIFDSEIFKKNNNYIKDIDISFNGSIDRPNRQKLFSMLELNNVEVYKPIFNVHKSLEEYISVFKRSKISLHISDDIYRQNARIYEVMFSKSCLFNAYSEITPMFFENGKHYIMYEDDCDLLDKIEYYLEHDEEREKIAQAGYERAIELCDPYNYWKRIFNRVGLSC